MIGYVKGKILSRSQDGVLILTDGGVGFEVTCSGSALSSVTGTNEAALYTYMHVTENGVAIYGFSSEEEKKMFLKLISVSGVGPKMGMAILTYLNVGEVAYAIAASDINRLSAVKGLGKKSAERIILELREKVGKIEGDKVSGVQIDSSSAGDEDAIVALMTLGYSRSESDRAVARAKSAGATTIEDIIMLAIKGM